jgi:hypothetical protein
MQAHHARRIGHGLAMRSRSSVEVLLARMVSGRTTASTACSTAVLTAISSNTASITRSTGASAS